MRTLGIIPARAGSKRLPGKNMRLLGGKPLVQWVIEAAKKSQRISQIVVSSDDAGVLELAGSHALPRPTELAADDSPAIDYVQHAISAVGNGFDAVAILQPTSPFTTAEDIDGALAMLEETGADSVVTVCRVPFMYRPRKQLTSSNGRLMCECPREDWKERVVRNCSVYATRVRSIEQGKVIGDDCRGYVMPQSRSIDINDEDDMRQAELMHLGNLSLVGYR